MQPKMNTVNNVPNTSFQGVSKVLKRERTFKLSLHALVCGRDAKGEEFREQTQINTISADTARFALKSPVTIGAPLNLALSVPKTLVLEKRMNLHVSGKVSMVQVHNNNSKQLITIRLNRTFKVLPPS